MCFTFACFISRSVMIRCHLLSVFLINFVRCVNYCELNCGNQLNTACMRLHRCGVCGNCPTGTVELKITQKEREAIIYHHNYWRNYVASCKANNNPVLKQTSSNMHVLSYDYDLQFTARCWVTQCRQVTEGDVCRRTENFYMPGQNVYYEDGNSDLEDLISEAVEYWYNKTKHFWTGIIANFDFSWSEDKVNYASQLLWAKTTHVGCSAIKTPDDQVLVCNYGPGGNLVGDPIYLRGKPCSDCWNFNIKETCNSNFTSLCGEIHNQGTGELNLEEPRMSSDRLFYSAPLQVLTLTIFLVIQ